MSNKLQEYRAEIDEIDKNLVKILSERFKITAKIGDYKWKHNLPPADRQREKEMFSERARWAKKLGIDQKLIIGIFKAIIKEVKKGYRFRERP